MWIVVNSVMFTVIKFYAALLKPKILTASKLMAFVQVALVTQLFS